MLKLVDIEMGSPRKFDKKTALDLAACNFNITSSIGIFMVNNALMATHGFGTLCFTGDLKHIHP
jgi:hypothetical protein